MSGKSDDKTIRAIGGKRYTVAINSQVNQVDFEVTKSCAGLLMRIQSLENIHMRVHLEDIQGKRMSLVNDISLIDYMCITQRLSDKVQVREVQVEKADTPGETETWLQFLLLFSLNGDLKMSDENKIIVQLFQKDLGTEFEEVKAYFEYYSFGKSGYPVQIEKQRILQSDDFKTLNVEGIDYLYIPIGTKFDYVQFDNEDGIGVRRKTYDQSHYDSAIHEIRNDIEFGTGGILIDTKFKKGISLSHLNEKDIEVYRVDVIQEVTTQNPIQNESVSILVPTTPTLPPKPQFSTTQYPSFTASPKPNNGRISIDDVDF